MRTPSTAGPRLVEITWAGERGLAPARPAVGQLVWGSTLGGSLGLLLVRLSFGWGGPSFVAGPIVAITAALAGGLIGAVLVRRTGFVRRPDSWALALALIWLLILFRPNGDAGMVATAGFAITLAVQRVIRRSARVGSVPARPIALAAGVGLTSLLVAWPRLARHVVPGDSGEFQALIPSLGIPHPTGYPLYVLLGKAFTLLPFGEPAFELSVLSAILGAIAAGLATLVALDLCRDELGAGLAAGFFAFSPIVVQQVVAPEVYSLHLALIAGLLWLLGQAGAGARRSPWVPLIALGIGLGLAHHRTIALILPSVIAAWLLSGRPVPPPRRALIAAGLLLLPLLTYLYFPWRWPAAAGHPLAWEEFRALVFADRFQTLVDPGRIVSIERYQLLFALLAEQLTALGLIFGLCGLVWSAGRSPKRALPTALLAVTTLVFSAAYLVPDVAVFLLPAQLAIALGAAVTVRLLRIWGGGWAYTFGVVVLAGLTLHLIAAWRSPPAPALAEVEAERGIAALPAGPALIVSDVDHFTPLLYASRVLAHRRDVDVVMPDTHEQAYEIVDAARAAGRQVYLARHLPRLADRYSVQSSGPLIAIEPAPTIDPGPVEGIVAGPGLRLARVAFPPEVRRSDQLAVDLEWWAEQPPAEAWRPVLALVDGEGRIRAAEPARDPVAGLFPFPLWRLGQRVRDFHQVDIPADLPSGSYQVWLLLLRPLERTPERVSDYLPGGEPIGIVTVTPDRTAPRADSGAGTTTVGPDLRLLDHRLPAIVEAGRPAALEITWQATAATPRRSIVVSLEGGARVEARADLTPLVAGETLITRVPLPPVGVGDWPVRLRIEEAGQPLLIRQGWFQLAATSAELAPLRVTPPAAALPTFDDRIELIGEDHPATVAAEETLSVRPRWRARSQPRVDYTVFVHLIDASGQVRAQVDSRPRQGTLPTDQWPLDTPIEDRYDIPLRDRVPPGRYRLVIGFYDARTMIRLPLTDPRGRPVADAYDLGEVTVTGAGGS